MKCDACNFETQKIKIRNNILYPYLNKSYYLCENCFKNKKIPYSDMIEIISLYNTYHEIPQEVKDIIETNFMYLCGDEILYLFYRVKDKYEKYNNFIESNGGNK